jgi:A/G-specific adenine glycosylase
MIDELRKNTFQATVWTYYRTEGRHDLPWRQAEANGSFDAYKIMLSEMMLQQTQVTRVVPKYHEFLLKFPDIRHLSTAPQSEVLTMWNGLGYNRRAKFLHQSAKKIVDQYNGVVPSTHRELMQLPGIGTNTASAILAYAYNQPVVFIETNIRSVFIHHFFAEQSSISDQSILEKVQQTLDQERPREWYWALMDYGVYLKKTIPNPNTRSKHYTKQSRFQGSLRQLRGQVLRLLSDHPYSKTLLEDEIHDKRLPLVLDELLKENLIQQRGARYHL